MLHSPRTNTGDNTVDGYVVTAHYLDQAFGEFINYLKKTGLYNNSMIVVYGITMGFLTIIDQRSLNYYIRNLLIIMI